MMMSFSHTSLLRPLSRLVWAGACFACACLPAHAEPDACAGRDSLGVSRTIEIDGTSGGLYGSMSARANRPGLLAKKEVVLTFDDGPMPWVTRSILDTLDKACVKATFFSVGRMALAYPDTVRDIVARGHTLGTHTYSHPFNMPRMAKDKAHTEIEEGFAAVAAAAGGPIAPFFRFTGLSDSAALLGYLETRGIAAFTVDAVSNDSYISDPDELTRKTIAALEASQGGILLFHDIKASTAKALAGILVQLKAKGFSVVHIVAKAPVEPKLELMAGYAQTLAKRSARAVAPPRPLPFYGAIGPELTKPASGPIAAQTPKPTTVLPTAAQNSAPPVEAERSGAAAMRQPLRGGLDLVKSSADEHPALSAFATGFPASRPKSSASAAHTSAGDYKGAIWDAGAAWSVDLTDAAKATPRKK